MLVTLTNVSAGQVFVSTIYRTVEAGGSVTFSRTQLELEREVQLKQLVADGDVTLAFEKEATDDVAVGFSQTLLSYSNTTRPAATDVPTFTMIWNTDDNSVNLSDGTNWRDAAGNIT